MENRKSFGVKKQEQSPEERKRYFQQNPRDPEPKNMVFGVQPILEALRSGKEMERLLIQREFGHLELVKTAEERGVPIQRVPAEKLNRITLKNHQGVIAYVSAVNYADLGNVVSSIFDKGEVPLLLVLDGITDVRNFGAIARTAECMGVHALIVPKRGAAQINADAMKTSSGALNFLPVCREDNLFNTIEYLQYSGIQVVASTEKGENSIEKIDFSLPTALVLGSEEDGIAPELLVKIDIISKIPMTGQVASLNVSVAAAMMIYEAVRQRGF